MVDGTKSIAIVDPDRSDIWAIGAKGAEELLENETIEVAAFDSFKEAPLITRKDARSSLTEEFTMMCLESLA